MNKISVISICWEVVSCVVAGVGAVASVAGLGPPEFVPPKN